MKFNKIISSVTAAVCLAVSPLAAEDFPSCNSGEIITPDGNCAPINKPTLDYLNGEWIEPLTDESGTPAIDGSVVTCMSVSTTTNEISGQDLDDDGTISSFTDGFDYNATTGEITVTENDDGTPYIENYFLHQDLDGNILFVNLDGKIDGGMAKGTCDTSKLVVDPYDDYMDGTDQGSFAYQITGDINLTQEIIDSDSNVRISLQKIGADNFWNGTDIDTNNLNSDYSVGANEGQYVLRLEVHGTNNMEFVYDTNTATWIPQKNLDMKPLDFDGNIVYSFDPMIDDSSNYFNWVPVGIGYLDVATSDINDINFNLAAFEASSYKVDFSVVLPGENYAVGEFCSKEDIYASTDSTGTNIDMSTLDVGICEWAAGGVMGSGYNWWIGEQGVRVEVLDASNGQYISEKKLNTANAVNDGGNTVFSETINLPKFGEYIFRIVKQSFDQTTMFTNWENYYFNPNTGELIDESQVMWIEGTLTDNWGNTVWLPDVTKTGKLAIAEVTDAEYANNNTLRTSTLNDAIDFAGLEASIVKLTGNVSFNGDTNSVNVELMNLQNGNWFGWQWFNQSGDYEIKLPGEGKYLVRVSRETSDYMWESFLVDLSDPNAPKFIPEYDVMWKDFVQETNGTLTPIDTIDNFDWSQPTMWLPDLSKVNPLIVADGVAVPPVVNINFESMDDQFFIVEGNVTLPSDFTPGEVMDTNGNWLGYNNVNFEVTNAITGEWITWQEIKKDLVGTDNGNNIYTYKLKLSQAGEYIVRVNYETFDSNTGMSDWSGYFVDFNAGTLISDKKIHHIPVLDETKYLADYNADMCWNEGKFWWDNPEAFEEYKNTIVIGETEDDMLEPNAFGKCYSEHPMNWIPDFDGTVSLSETNKNIIQNLDFVAIENNVYKISGTISGLGDFLPNHNWENLSNIRVEAINSNTGEWLGDGHIQFMDGEQALGAYSYSFKLDGVSADTNVTIKIVKEQNQDNNWNHESYFINFGADNAPGGDGDNADSFVSEDQVQWIEKEVDGQSWTMWAPDATQTGFITLGETKSITLDVDYGQGESSYESNKLALSGTITTTEPVMLGSSENGWWNNIRVEAMKKSTGEWMGSVDAQYSSNCTDKNNCSEFTYEMVFPEAGEYIIQITKEVNGEWENYFYNFGSDNSVDATVGVEDSADKLINGQKVEWKEADEKMNASDMWKNWMPNPEQSGYINLTAKTTMNIDFTAFESSQITISGVITIPEDFNIGEYCTDNNDVVGICEWSGGEIGFINWYGNKNIRVEAIHKDNGRWLGSIDVRNKIENTNQYEFKLKLGEASEIGENFIVKIIKEESGSDNWKFDEIYYNFGEDHAIGGSDDKLTNGKKVEWIEAAEAEFAGQMWKNWMPNPSKTGWIQTAVSVNDFNIDLTSIGANDYFVKGSINFKADFDLSNENTFADISIIDASTGMWVGNAPINNDGTFELNIGEDSGEFIVQVNYSYNDYRNWENSWWKNKFYDFGSDKAYNGGDDQILNDSDVMWMPIITADMKHDDVTKPSECWMNGYFWYDEEQACYDQPMNWVPNVNPITIDDNVVTVTNNKKVLDGVVIDLSTSTGKTLNIEITNIPAEANNPYIFVVNPLSYGGSWIELKEDNGIYTASISELKIADYTVEFGYDTQNGHEHFFIKDSDNDLSNGVGVVPGFEVRWEELDANTHMWGPSSVDTTYLDMSNDLNLSITIVAPDYNELNATVSGLDSDKDLNVDFRSLSNPYGKYEMLTSDGSGNIAFNFDDVKNGDYVLSFWYDGNEYTYDQSESKLKKDVMWVAFNETGTQVCPTGDNNDNWNCDWTNSNNWQWRPDVAPLTFTDSDKTLTLAMPTALKISGTIDLSDDFAGKNLNVSVFKHNGQDWNWKDFVLDTNGDVNGSIKVNGGDDYRIELWVDGLGGYVYTASGWISQNNSWAENATTHMWEPKAETLISINANLDLGTVTIGSDFKTVTVVVENLDTDTQGNIVEDVWVSLESDTQGYYGEGNANWDVQPVTYDNNVTFKVPASSDYKLLVFPMNHNGGFANDNSGISNAITTATKLSWNEQDTVNVTNSTTVTVTLPSAANLGEINGTVDCGTSDCSGWIDAMGNMNGKGAPVEADGTFQIKGLDAGNFEVMYWANDGSMLNQHSVTVSEGETTEITLVKDTANMITINGSVTASTFDNKEVVIIETDGTNWEVIVTNFIETDGSFDLGSMPEPISGTTYMVAVMAKTYDENTYESTVSFGAAVDTVTSSGVTMAGSFNATLSDTVVLGQ